jgi:hypothetical protein
LADPRRGAQRASIEPLRVAAALALSIVALAFTATTAAAATSPRIRVVVIVGPVGPMTSSYVAMGRRLAVEARGYGASVAEIYSPNATWARVRSASRGANLLIYLGHGNGSPSPYEGGQASHNGLGLNASASGSNSNVRYYGETYIAHSIHLAPNAVVILNHLCYASGNNEWGSGNPTRSVALQRVDNYGEGFLRAGAAAVFAEGIAEPGYILRNLFGTGRTMREIFWASPNATHRYAISFTSHRVPGATAIMDPYRPNRYYRSVVGRLDVTASAWR